LENTVALQSYSENKQKQNAGKIPVNKKVVLRGGNARPKTKSYNLIKKP